VLTKAEAFADARKLDQGVLMVLRLYPDMFPLNVQVGQVTTHAARGVAQLAGLDAAPSTQRDKHRSAQGAHRKDRRIREDRQPEQIDGTEDKEIVLKFGTRE